MGERIGMGEEALFSADNTTLGFIGLLSKKLCLFDHRDALRRTSISMTDNLFQ